MPGMASHAFTPLVVMTLQRTVPACLNDPLHEVHETRVLLTRGILISQRSGQPPALTDACHLLPNADLLNSIDHASDGVDDP